MDIIQRCDKLLSQDMKPGKIKSILLEEFGIIYDVSARKYQKRNYGKNKPNELVYDKKYKKPVLVFSDVHIPFNHKHFLKFLKDIDKKFGCAEQKICTGDLVDNHAISRHSTEDEAMSAKDEYNKAKGIVSEYVKAFPKVKLCIGNHGAIPKRLAKEFGLYSGFLKNFNEVWDLPDTWEVAVDHYYKDVLYSHGLNMGGVMGVRNAAIKEGMSTIIGHYHSHACVHYIANKSKMIFGANAGCGIDVHSYAFEYGRHFKDKPTIGCIVVFSPEWAVFVPMSIEYYNEKYGR